ncbi:MAG: hypothetical protein OEM28_07915 [Nitrosopumilus sp.]|nr:hypothetical protein [Nitrosopumilus sp.]MDH3488364.1 hypothetical protein [Nitrosopumilus sp.]
MIHQCYYCNLDFKSRKELYDHVAIHVKTRNYNSQKTDNNKPKIEIKDNDKNKTALINIQSNIDRLTKKIEELHERIEAHTKNQ